MGKFIAVIDYGVGNLDSVAKALEAVGAKPKVTGDPKDIGQASAVVLPGVGAFGSAMDSLKRLGFLPSLPEAIKEGKPFLGICLGLQLLFTESEEHGIHKGFDILEGRVIRLDAGVKIPHMGWNQVELKTKNQKGKIFDEISDKSYFYFVHSYYVEPADESVVIATTEYGKEFASAVNKNNVWGLQFHPEKSAGLGLKIMENFSKHVS